MNKLDRGAAPVAGRLRRTGRARQANAGRRLLSAYRDFTFPGRGHADPPGLLADVVPHAVDPGSAQRLWTLSEELLKA